MQDLSSTERRSLGPFSRRVYESLKHELSVHEGRSVDAARTRFWIDHDPHPDYADSMHCDIRRTDPSSLDFAVGVFEDAHPYVGLGNLPTENWSLEDLDLDDFANEDELIERLIGLVRDWLGGRMQVVTKYAGNVPCHWIVKCGDEILAEGRRFIYPYWAKKRTVVQHS